MSVASEEALARRRAHMVEDQLVRRGVRDPAVLDAMRSVERHRFLPPEREHLAYRDQAVHLVAGQTLSQPYIVALMSELARVRPGDRVLDVGTGSGYQAAILSALGARVFSIEIVKTLADLASQRLQELGYDVQVRHGDGWEGWPEEAPFRAILVAAATPRVPPPLLDQLDEGGRLILPIGDDETQELVVLERTPTGFDRRRVTSVLFVPFTGSHTGEPPPPESGG